MDPLACYGPRLAILDEAQGREKEEALSRVKGRRCSLKALGEVLNEAHKSAWEETLKAHVETLGGGGSEIYHSTVELYVRGSKDFAEEKLRRRGCSHMIGDMLCKL